MRETPRVEYFLIAVTVLVAVQTIRDAWRTGPENPSWDLRWRALDPGDQSRLAVAGLSRSTTAALVDADEREMAEGFARRDRRRRAYLDLVLLAALALTSALMLAGATDHRTFGLVLGAFALVRWPLDSLRDRQIKRGLKPASAIRRGERTVGG